MVCMAMVCMTMVCMAMVCMHYKTKLLNPDLLCANILQGFLKQRFKGYKLFLIHTHTHLANCTHVLICTYSLPLKL